MEYMTVNIKETMIYLIIEFDWTAKFTYLG